MTTRELKEKLKNSNETYPVSSAYDATHGQRKGVHWNNQKEHLLPWLDAQETHGCGGFTRLNINTDAERMYNHLSCPECLLWLCEAAGVPYDVVNAAAEKAKLLEKVVSRAASIRRDIPWSEVENRLNIES